MKTITQKADKTLRKQTTQCYKLLKEFNCVKMCQRQEKAW